MDGKKINLITPPIEYGGDEEADKPCMCGECNSHTQPKQVKPSPDIQIKIDDKD